MRIRRLETLLFMVRVNLSNQETQILANMGSYMAGEMSAIKNCTAILTDPHGRYRMTASEAEDAFADLTLYTNAESCPMV